MQLYLITPNFSTKYLDCIKRYFDSGHTFLQLRSLKNGLDESLKFIEQVRNIATAYPDSKLFINQKNNHLHNGQELVTHFDLAGIHCSQYNYNNTAPTSYSRILSCHNKKEIEFAESKKCKFITISPVFYTTSHPEQTDTLGIEKFNELSESTHIPTFALGGLSQQDIPKFAKIKNCYGIAIISDWFKNN